MAQSPCLLGDGATLQFGIEGLTRPALGMAGQYGAIDATNATLDGVLALDFDFAGVQLGDMFELVRLDPAGMFTGFFDDTMVMGLPGGLTAEAAIVGNSLIATVVMGAFAPGDVNFDGFVDIFDVNLVSANWGTTGPTGDANGDGIVDIFDVNLISANWSPPPAPPSGAAVPEPSSIGLASFALAALLAAIRKRCRQAKISG